MFRVLCPVETVESGHGGPRGHPVHVAFHHHGRVLTPYRAVVPEAGADPADIPDQLIPHGMAAGDGPPVRLGSGKRWATSALEHEGDCRDGGLQDHRLLVVGRAHERCVTVSDDAQAPDAVLVQDAPSAYELVIIPSMSK